MTKLIKNSLFLAFVLAVLAGCETTSQTDTGAEGADQASAQTAEPTEPAEPVAAEPVQNTVYFDFDKSVLRPEAQDVLSAHAEYLKATGAQIIVEGHCDERGTREYNMALGERRANAVRDFLVAQGVSATQIETVSYGEERPVAMGHDEAAWALNRRGEVVYEK